jgi:hypothetical protein
VKLDWWRSATSRSTSGQDSSGSPEAMIRARMRDSRSPSGVRAAGDGTDSPCGVFFSVSPVRGMTEGVAGIRADRIISCAARPKCTRFRGLGGRIAVFIHAVRRQDISLYRITKM